MPVVRLHHVLAALAVASAPGHAVAGSTMIRDEALKDLAVTPVLGRGYSIATNTFQSICYTDIAKTKPSYNFRYRFEEVTADQAERLKEQGSIGGSFSGGGFGVSVQASASVKAGKEVRKDVFKHSLLVSIDLDVYYSSIDESKGRFATAAANLLRKRDLPGFFDACGMYYTRSINRTVRFISIFSYESESTTRDETFEAQLEATVKGWGQSGSINGSMSKEFSQKASSSKLTIESHGFGLGKSESASLISYDLDSFRAAVKQAFMASQAEDVGMVTSIEVAPWVEHSEFQDLLELESREVPDPKCVAAPPADPAATGPAATPSTPCPTVTRTAYEQKRILTQNSEFLSEVDRAARGKLNVYFRAKQCAAAIKFDYKSLGADGVTWAWLSRGNGTWGDAEVQNHRTNKWDRKLREVDNAVVPYNLNLVFKEYDAFMYGGSDEPSKWGAFVEEHNRQSGGAPIPTGAASPSFQEMSAYGFYVPAQFPGAAQCVKDLLADDRILLGSYRNLASCQRVEEQFAVVSGQTVNDYCLPRPR